MRRLAAAAFAFALAGLPAAARADLFSSVSYGVHLSTVGDGLTLEKPLLYNFGLRLETNTLSVSDEHDYDGQRYASTSRFRSIAVIGEFRPYNSRYRINGGVLFGTDEIDNVLRAESPLVRVGNGTYPFAGTGIVTSRVRFDRPGIYFGAGTGTGLIRGLALTLDGGVLIRNGHADARADGPLAADPALRADLRRLAGELRTRVVSPVFSVGLVYRP